MTSWFLDKLLRIILFGSVHFSPFSRSKTGFANPLTRNFNGITYTANMHWMLIQNITKWLDEKKTLFPAVVQVQTINRCNGRCAICPYSYTIHLQERGVIEDDLFRKIASECARENDLLAFVPMSKNEPLLDRKLENRIHEFKTVAAPHQYVEIVTNGSALTPSRYKKLVASGLDMISISLNATTEEMYQKVKQGLSWRQVMRNLDAISETDTSKVNIFLRYIQQVDNAKGFLRFWWYWKKKGFNIVSFDINNRSGTVKNYEGLIPNRKLLSKHLLKAVGRLYHGLCPQVFSVAHIMQDGDMPMCSNDWHNREILGNVNANTIREIFNSPRMQEIRELMRRGRYDAIAPCRDCSIHSSWLCHE